MRNKYYSVKAASSGAALSKRSKETRMKLSSSFKELVSAKGYETVDISMIAKCSGINRQSFYYHFAGKEALALYILDTDARKLDEKIRDRLIGWDAVVTVCRFFYGDRNFYRMIVNSRNFVSAYSRIHYLIFPLIKKAIGEVLDLPEESDSCTLASDMLVATIIRWIAKESPPDPSSFLLNYKRQLLYLSEEYIIKFGNSGILQTQ